MLRIFNVKYGSRAARGLAALLRNIVVLIRNEPVYLWHARAGLVWQPRPTKRFEGKQTAPPRICCVWLYVLY